MVNDGVDISFNLLYDPLYEQYKNTTNVLYIWKAIQLGVSNNLDLPQWVLDYLLEVSTSLLSINVTKKEAGEKIKKAIKIDDARDFSRFNDLSLEFYSQVVENMDKQGSEKRCGVAIDTAAEKYHVGREKAVKIYYKLKEIADEDAEIAKEISGECLRGEADRRDD